MDKHDDLPFKVGQEAEARSFLQGFRGAWFRCKIKEISLKKGHIGHVLEYIDFPDEKLNWTKLYQKPPISKSKSKEKRRELMLRPPFPPVNQESQTPDVNTMSEVTVLVNDVWKVGDLVDWWTDGCFWSGKVTQLVEPYKVKIDLLPPPDGEGLSYEVFCKELRPSLDWSPSVGWRVPIPKESETGSSCARLVKPAYYVPPESEERKNLQDIAESSPKFKPPFSSHAPTCERSPDEGIMEHPLDVMNSKKEKRRLKTEEDLDRTDVAIGRTSPGDSVSSSHIKDVAEEMTGGRDEFSNYDLLKRMKTDGNLALNCLNSDTIEDTILDLEELVNKIKWIKGILEHGNSLPNVMQPPWKFLGHRAPSTPK